MSQNEVMELIRNNPGISQVEINQELAKSKQIDKRVNVSLALKLLRNKNLVWRKPGKLPGRKRSWTWLYYPYPIEESSQEFMSKRAVTYLESKKYRKKLADEVKNMMIKYPYISEGELAVKLNTAETTISAAYNRMLREFGRNGLRRL